MLCAKIQVPTLCDIPENSKCTSYELATIFQVSCLLPSYTIRCTLFQGNLLFRSRDSLLYSSNVFGRQRLITNQNSLLLGSKSIPGHGAPALCDLSLLML